MRTKTCGMSKAAVKLHLNRAGNVHEDWYDWQDHFKQWYFNLVPGWTIKNGKMGHTKRKYRHFDIKQVKGYPAMCRMDRYIEKHPEIVGVNVDDSYYASSTVYLIPHKDEKRMRWHGITVLNVPQCSPEQNTFFLYPHHLDDLIKQLLKLQKEMRVYLREEKKRREE